MKPVEMGAVPFENARRGLKRCLVCFVLTDDAPGHAYWHVNGERQPNPSHYYYYEHVPVRPPRTA